MPVEIEVHTVSHFKAPVNCRKKCEWLKDAGIFRQWTSIVKMGRLVNKTSFVWIEVLCTVFLFSDVREPFGIKYKQ